MNNPLYSRPKKCLNKNVITEKIEIIKSEQTGDKWNFTVAIGDDDNAMPHNVVLEDEYYEQLTDRQVDPEELVVKSFEFLLERETKESIMENFDVSQIRDYFGDYETEIKKRIRFGRN